jgi:hypothetical protein
MLKKKPAVIPCELLPEVKKTIHTYAKELRDTAHTIGSHGLSRKQFWDSGIFRSAIERLRGIQAASMGEKRGFMDGVLNFMQSGGGIKEWKFTGSGERHDYEIKMTDGRICIVETKGCLDGNNTNIFERPSNADEFIIWSLCQNPGADPRHNAWSGIHTRLGAEIIHRKQKVDGLVIWDMVCGTSGRPCPKIRANPERQTHLNERILPPPCIYLFPRSIPDPKNNPNPPVWKINDVFLLRALFGTFHGEDSDVVEVHIEARMSGADVERKTTFLCLGDEIAESKWTPIKRAIR